MSCLRLQAKAGIQEKIEALLPTVSVLPWAGEEAIFNGDCTYPSISIAFGGTDFGEDLEVGDGATYNRDFFITVFVSTQNDEFLGAGDDQACELLEAIEVGLFGYLIPGVGKVVTSGEEKLNGVYLGRYLYHQLWKVPTLESH